MSADGLHVYVAGELDDAVAVFERQAVTGDLAFVHFLRDGVAGVNGLGNVRGTALSPDGKHLYTASPSDNGVGIFARNATTGELSYLGIRVDGAPQPPLTLDGLAGAAAVAVSPDGSHVYVAGETDDAIAVFTRDAATGGLTFVEVKKDGLGGVDGLNGIRALALSDDGLHLYAAGALDNAVAVFARDAETGALTFVEAEIDGASGADGLAGASGVAVSPDGEHVYVSGETDSAIAVLARNPVTGALTPQPAGFDGVGGLDGLQGVRGSRRLPRRRAGLRRRRGRGCSRAPAAGRRLALHLRGLRLDRRHGRYRRGRLAGLFALRRGSPRRPPARCSTRHGSPSPATSWTPTRPTTWSSTAPCSRPRSI